MGYKTGQFSLTKFLGIDAGKVSILSSATFAILCLFYVYTLAAFIPVKVNILVDRVIYTDYFAGSIFSSYLDQVFVILLAILWILNSLSEKKLKLTISLLYVILLISGTLNNISVLLSSAALSTLPVVVLFLALNSRRISYLKKRTSSITSFSVSINYIMFSSLLIGIASIIVSIVHILYPGFSGLVDNYQYEIYLVFASSFSPFLLLLLFFCFPVRYLVFYLKKGLKARQSKRMEQASSP